MKIYFSLFILSGALAFFAPVAHAATPLINCASGFNSSTSGACSVTPHGGQGAFFNLNVLVGSTATVVPAACQHCGSAFNYQTQVNVQAFTATWSFVPNEFNGAFVLQNNTNNQASGGGCSGNSCIFAAGAGYEVGFYQAFSSNGKSTNNTFALEFYDNHSFASCTSPTCSGSSYTGSTVQIYQPQQAPYNPNYGTEHWYWTTTKILTGSIPLSSPATTMQSSTGDLYSATVTYDGTTLTYSLYDKTTGGSCPGAHCFTQSWNNINIPSIVGSNVAYLGFTGGTNDPSVKPFNIGSFVYTVNTPPARPSYSTYTSQSYTGSPHAAAPTFSPAAGTYAGTQSVTIHSTTTGAYYCYALSASAPSLMPQTDNTGGCTVGTLYTGPVSVSSSQTLYAMAGTTQTGLPSDLVVGAFVIGGAPPPPSAGACDMNQDGAINAADVQSAVNQTLGIATCGTADLQNNGQCTAVDVQRVVNAVLGGQCVTGL